MKILVTGAAGFIGRHVVEALRLREYDVFPATLETTEVQLRAWAKAADAVVHLAGSNRPTKESEFAEVNRDFTVHLLTLLKTGSKKPLVVFSSSTQAAQLNPYGISKLAAEEALREFVSSGAGSAVVFRFPNVFGKWCQPNYNSVVATFCFNAMNGIESTVSDPEYEVTFVYIDDVVASILAALDSKGTAATFEMRSVPVTYKRKLGTLYQTIQSFRDMRKTLRLPDFADRFTVSLYATYLSYLPPDQFDYDLDKKEDERGSLAEFLKSEHVGQLFISRTRPGITRGNHYHDTKTEKFLIVEGEGIIRFRHIESEQVLEYRIKGEDYRVVDIPPGYTHSIENVGPGEMVTLFWASEMFDPKRTDTIYVPVSK